MVLTVSFVLAPETGLVVSVAAEKRQLLRQLDISVGISGPHDFAVRLRAFVWRVTIVHRIPRSTLVTTAIRPSNCEAGRPESVMLRLANREAKYFAARGWTRAAHCAVICPSGRFFRSAVPILTFVSHRSGRFYEGQNQRHTSNSMIPVWR